MRFCLALFTLAAAQLAQAQLCDNKEYAQYKDAAKNAWSRWSMAEDYCRFSKLGACRQDQQKIADALLNSGDSKMVAWMLKGCEGEAPLPRTTPKAKPAAKPL